jgi:hypothetical protein
MSSAGQKIEGRLCLRILNAVEWTYSQGKRMGIAIGRSVRKKNDQKTPKTAKKNCPRLFYRKEL